MKTDAVQLGHTISTKQLENHLKYYVCYIFRFDDFCLDLVDKSGIPSMWNELLIRTWICVKLIRVVTGTFHISLTKKSAREKTHYSHSKHCTFGPWAVGISYYMWRCVRTCPENVRVSLKNKLWLIFWMCTFLRR